MHAMMNDAMQAVAAEGMKQLMKITSLKDKQIGQCADADNTAVIQLQQPCRPQGHRVKQFPRGRSLIEIKQ